MRAAVAPALGQPQVGNRDDSPTSTASEQPDTNLRSV